MSDSDRLGWGSLQTGLFGVTIAALGTDIFSKPELMAMSLLLMLFGILGLVGSMAVSLGVFDDNDEVIGQ
jgi:hypothetical protein